MEFEEILDQAGKKRDELIATELLVSSKATVRAYAVALTETISPEVREILKRQLSQALNQHSRIADYMIEREMYHPFDLDKQVKKDKKKVKKARKIVSGGAQQKKHSQKNRRTEDTHEAPASDPEREAEAPQHPIESGSHAE